MLGPVLGGYLTDTFSWRWVFYINVPIGILAVIMTNIFIFDPQYIRRRSARIDYWGIGMLAIGIACLQVVLDKGQEKDWFGSRFITILALISAFALIAFIVYELRTHDPVVDLRVFKNITYSTGVFLMAMLGIGLYGSLVVIPLVLQTLLGYPPLQAGIAMAPRGLGSFLAMPAVGLIMAKVDARKLLGLGIVICAATLVQLSLLNLNAGFWNFFWPQFYMGLALGMLFVPLTTVSMDPIPNESMGNATSLFNLVRNVGGSIGIAAVTAIQTRQEQADTNILGSHIAAGNLQAKHTLNLFRGLFSSQGAGPKESMKMAYDALFQMVERQASIISYDTTFRLLALLFLGMLPFLILVKRPGKKGGPVAMH